MQFEVIICNIILIFVTFCVFSIVDLRCNYGAIGLSTNIKIPVYAY